MCLFYGNGVLEMAERANILLATDGGVGRAPIAYRV